MVEPTLQDKMSSVPEFIWIKNQIDKIKKVIEQGDDPEDSISLPELTASLIRLLFKSKAALEVIELIEEKEVEPEPNNYYHYTSIHALRSILPVSKEKQDEGRNYLRVASLEGVNDPEEGTALREYCKSRKNFESEDECGFICGDCLYRFLEHGIDDEISMHMFMLCFSDSGDRLDLWRMYAKDGEGFSIGIPKREFGGSMVHGFDFTEETIAPAEFSKEALLPDQLPLPKSTSKKSESKNKPINLCKPVRVHYKDDAKGAAAKMVCRAISEIMDKYEKLKEMEWKREALKNHDSRTREFSINETKKNSASRNYLFAAQGVMLELLYRFKYEDYESEREYRIFSFQPEISTSEIDENLAKEGKAAPVFFPSEAKLFKNPDYEIYIGPRVKLPGTFKLELEHRLSKQPGNWSKNVTIHNSKTHYR